jgi:hypothetical protein
MRLWIGALVMMAACGGGTAAPVHVDNATSAPAGPAPTIAWAATDGGDFDGDFEISGLPAISADGTLIVYAHQGEDGARGEPNLTIVVKDTADAVVHREVVLEYADQFAPPSPDAIAAANRYLAAQAWTPIQPAHVVASDPYAGVPFSDSASATLGGRTVRFAASEHPAWAVPDAPMYPGAAEMCSNPAYLGGAWIAPDRGVALVLISYLGNDSCWEPDSEEHVVSL